MMEEVTLNKRYRLIEPIGSGGMAVVYKATDTLLQRRVAVKILREQFSSDPDFLTRFRREAQAAAKLDHPNIVIVHDVGQDGSRHYIVMEYVDGQDLKTLIRQKEQGRLSIAETLDLSIQICTGVGHAHKAGLIHCDIKPQNVLINQQGQAKVADFGIARAFSETDLQESERVAKEKVWGSPHYFSPEQAAGEPLTPASDVYSIGIIMYEMLAGTLPFHAEKATALALMHIREEPPPLAVRNPQTPPRLEWIIRKVLTKEPAARYRTAGQLAHILKEYQKQGEQETSFQPTVQPPQAALTPKAPDQAPQAQPSRLNSLAWALGIVALIAIAGLVPLWWLVYQAYSAPSALPPTSTPPPLVTRTQAVQMITVPNVVDMPEEEARRNMELAGLRLEVIEERPEPKTEAGIVLEQSPPPGTELSPDSVIEVIVSAPTRELEMQSITGYSLEAVQGGLESDGLNVHVEEEWRTEEAGMVVEQIPEPGASIHVGDTVTLTVSSGPAIELGVNLANRIRLESAELQQKTFHPGGVFAITLRWEALQAIDTPYVVFVHLIGPAGDLAAQQDTEPKPATTQWVPSMRVDDQHQFTIPNGRAAGRYQLRVGMYPQGQPANRLTVVDPGSTTADMNSIFVAEVKIEP